MGEQVDGTHYEEMPYQPWDIIKANKLDYWAGTIVKYVLRAGAKPGVPKSTDLKKAAHFLREYIQLTEDAENAAAAMESRAHPTNPKTFPGVAWETVPTAPLPGEKHKDAG